MSRQQQSVWSHAIHHMGGGFPIALAAAALTLLGLIILLSVGMGSGNPLQHAGKQLVWVLLSLIAFLTFLIIDFERLRSLAWPIGLVGIGLLLLVFIPGVGLKINGARRWIDLGPMNMQVADFAKIAYLFVLAHLLAQTQRERHTFLKGYVLPVALIGIFCGLIIVQPDFGTTVLFGAVGGTMLFLAGVRFRFLIPTAVLALSAFAFLVWRDPVRLARITSFLDVEANRADGAYQLWQALVAFAAGGPGGVGLGNGIQQRAYLPEAQTDFVFAIVGEELGLIATTSVVALFVAIIIATLWELRRAPTLFQFLLVAGALLFISLQAIINLGVVTGLLPTKGMSLPFVSYGGSNLLTTFALIGLMVNCFRHWRRAPLSKPLELCPVT